MGRQMAPTQSANASKQRAVANIGTAADAHLLGRLIGPGLFVPVVHDVSDPEEVGKRLGV